MPNRYTYTNTIKEPDTNKTYLETTIYPRVKPSDNDFYIISQAGDRLDMLAHKYYGNTNLWWIIAVTNNLNDANFFVEEGIQLRIPADVAKISADLKKINE